MAQCPRIYKVLLRNEDDDKKHEYVNKEKAVDVVYFH